MNKCFKNSDGTIFDSIDYLYVRFLYNREFIRSLFLFITKDIFSFYFLKSYLTDRV